MVLPTWILDVLLLPVSKVDSKVFIGYGRSGGKEDGAIQLGFLYF